MGFVALGLCVGVHYYSKLLEASLAGGKALNSWWCVNVYPQGFALGWIDLLARNVAEFLHQVKGTRLLGFAACPKHLICILIKPSSLLALWHWPFAKAICLVNKAQINLAFTWIEVGLKGKVPHPTKGLLTFFKATVFSHISWTSAISETEKTSVFLYLPFYLNQESLLQIL